MNRTATRLTTLAVALAIGCSEQATDPLTTEKLEDETISQGVYVLNTQLRGIIDPDIQPTPAWGHVQIKLTDDGEAGYRIEWKGKLFNPESEVFSSAFIINPDIIGGPGDGEPTGSGFVFTLFRGASESCGILLFDSQGITDAEHIPVEAALNMIIDPEIHEVVLVSTEGSFVVGRFGIPDPTELIGFNPQPDLSGKIVRCDVSETT
jgi:hypothetical protein